MDLSIAAGAANALAHEKGYWDIDPRAATIGCKFGLIHSEVDEAMQAWRKDQGDAALTTELADILIRVLDIAAELGVAERLEGAFKLKMDVNADRPRHWRKT